MKRRLLLGPVLVLFLIGGLALDQWLDARALPDFLASTSRTTWPPGTVLLPIMLLIAALAARELAAIIADKGLEASKRILTAAAVTGLLLSCLVPSTLPAVDAVAAVSSGAAAILTLALVFYSRRRTVEGVIAGAGGALLAFVYLGLMFGFILAIRRDHSAWTLLWVLLVTKACDIGAYFSGKAFGRHKLIPWLSPGKTWEGLVGGILLSMAVSAGGIILLRRHASVPHADDLFFLLFPGLLFGLVGQLGDLLESLLKRDAGIKDSGRSIPGFGGVLDVIDSPLLVAPFAFWWLRFAVAPH